MDDWENVRISKVQSVPDQDQRLFPSRHGESSRRRYRVVWIAVIVALLVVAFAVMLSVDPGGPESPSGQGDFSSVTGHAQAR